LQTLTNLDAVTPALPTEGLTVLDAPPPKTPKQQRRIALRIDARRFARLQQHQRAVDVLRPLPQPGEAVHGVTDGSFSGWMLASAIVELLQPAVDVLTICTLGFNRENARDLCGLLDSGAVRSCLLLVSDYFRSSDRTIFADIRRDLEARGHRVAIARSHAKLLLFEAGERQIVLETSANLRSSMNWEQFVISDDQQLLAFHRGWIKDLISEGSQ
jgi:hypothetical protein